MVTSTETFSRVIPRDFFNESKLLKCMGFLALKVLDFQLPEGITIEIEESGEPFKIELSPKSGFLSVVNYPVSINDKKVIVGTEYNGKANFPFYAYVGYDCIEIFNDNGDFTEEFIEYFTPKN